MRSTAFGLFTANAPTPQDEDMWVEYYRLELLYVAKLRLRRELLGLDVGGPGECGVGNSWKSMGKAGAPGRGGYPKGSCMGWTGGGGG